MVNIIKVMEDIRKYMENFKNDIPGLEATVRNDGSIDVKNSINTLGTSAFFGVILVFVSLFVFLGWRNALFAAFGIPFSFLLTFILMQYFDVTMNNLTLFGLVLVLGMIVDDAIIVLENVHRYVEQGHVYKRSGYQRNTGDNVACYCSGEHHCGSFCSHVDDAGYDGKIHAGIPDSCFIGFISFII